MFFSLASNRLHSCMRFWRHFLGLFRIHGTYCTSCPVVSSVPLACHLTGHNQLVCCNHCIHHRYHYRSSHQSFSAYEICSTLQTSKTGYQSPYATSMPGSSHKRGRTFGLLLVHELIVNNFFRPAHSLHVGNVSLWNLTGCITGKQSALACLQMQIYYAKADNCRLTLAFLLGARRSVKTSA